MNEIREIHTYEDTTSTNTAMLGIFIVALIALIGIGLAVWQPWTSGPVRSETTHIIQQPAADQPDTTIVNPPSTTIINPPAQSTEPSKTEININGGGSGEETSGGTTGSESSSESGGQ